MINLSRSFTVLLWNLSCTYTKKQHLKQSINGYFSTKLDKVMHNFSEKANLWPTTFIFDVMTMNFILKTEFIV